MGMTNQEAVRILNEQRNRFMDEYIDFGGVNEAFSKAIDLLKDEPRVMTLDELTEIYVEFKDDICPTRLTNFDLQKIMMYAVAGDCRLWTGKPTDEQRKAVKWE